jgi:hypothetical protein
MALKHSKIGRYSPAATISFKDLRGNADESNSMFGHGDPQFELPAILVDYRDTFSANWNSQDVLGRMDPIYTYKNTQREIGFTVDVPCEASVDDGAYALAAIGSLIRFTYPNYEVQMTKKGTRGHGVMMAPPIIGIKFGNLIEDSVSGAHLPGILQAVAFSPLAGTSKFHPPSTSVPGNYYIPKRIQLAIVFKPVHTHPLGYDQTGKPRKGFSRFPYGGRSSGGTSSPVVSAIGKMEIDPVKKDTPADKNTAVKVNGALNGTGGLGGGGSEH